MNKSCPFCGSEAVELDFLAFSFGKIDTFWIKCTKCGAIGPSALTEKMAWDLWNERAEDDNDEYNT